MTNMFHFRGGKKWVHETQDPSKVFMKIWPHRGKAVIAVGCAVMIILSTSAWLPAQIKTDDVLGFWMTANDNAKVEIYKSGGAYFGKIVWINPNPKIPEHGHSHSNAVSEPKVGDVLLKDLLYDGDREWEDGTIYDPYSRETYSCYVAMTAPSVLKVRGYTGLYLIGRTEYWTRTR